MHKTLRQWIGLQPGESEHTQPRFGLLLLMILLMLMMTALAADYQWGQAIIVIMYGATFILALYMSGARRIVRMVGILAVVSTLIVGALSSVTLTVGVTTGMQSVTTVFALATPFAIASRLRRFERVERQTVMAALCIYLLIGLFFVAVYGTLNVVSSQPLFAQIDDPSRVDLVYFSFVTLATVGYGDLSGATDIMRMLSIIEALIGQLYLVSVVALVVANMGRVIRRPDAAAPPPSDPLFGPDDPS